ncbi:septum formation family protein [Kitasatospora sp. NPDC051853]|uniref:septum formation family protein n=1 Tax=Kitasatospora sp. NPDC051853 TaxID=3364058 RepID=UPI0037AB6182
MTENQPFPGGPSAADPWAVPPAAVPARRNRTWFLLGTAAAVVVSLGVAGVLFYVKVDDLVREVTASGAGPETGQCYVEGVRSGQDDSVLVSRLRTVPCEQQHEGEVAGTVRLEDSLGAEPTDRQISHAGMLACSPKWDAYAPDGWALPRHVGESHIYPSSRQWALGKREVICVFDGGRTGSTGSVRIAPGSLNEAQLAYLRAVNPYNRAYAEDPSYGSGDVERADLQEWVRQMAEASDREAQALRAVAWPEPVREPMRRMLDAKDRETAAWRAAVHVGDAEELEDLADSADEISSDSTGPAAQVRKALGLATGSTGSPSAGTPPVGGLQA